MEIVLVKYREDTKRYQCYEVQKSDQHKISGNLFFPLDTPLPPMFTINLPEYSDLVPTNG